MAAQRSVLQGMPWGRFYLLVIMKMAFCDPKSQNNVLTISYYYWKWFNALAVLRAVGPRPSSRPLGVGHVLVDAGVRSQTMTKEANAFFILKMNNVGIFLKCCTRFGKCSVNVYIFFFQFLRGVAKFRQNFVEMERKNGKIQCGNFLENAKL